MTWRWHGDSQRLGSTQPFTASLLRKPHPCSSQQNPQKLKSSTGLNLLKGGCSPLCPPGATKRNIEKWNYRMTFRKTRFCLRLNKFPLLGHETTRIQTWDPTGFDAAKWGLQSPRVNSQESSGHQPTKLRMKPCSPGPGPSLLAAFWPAGRSPAHVWGPPPTPQLSPAMPSSENIHRGSHWVLLGSRNTEMNRIRSLPQGSGFGLGDRFVLWGPLRLGISCDVWCLRPRWHQLRAFFCEPVQLTPTLWVPGHTGLQSSHLLGHPLLPPTSVPLCSRSTRLLALCRPTPDLDLGVCFPGLTKNHPQVPLAWYSPGHLGECPLPQHHLRSNPSWEPYRPSQPLGDSNNCHLVGSGGGSGRTG